MSALHWFRLYHRMIDDEKIRLIAFEDRWHFIAVCCLKADGLLDEPDSPLKWRKVAVKMGVQSRDLEEIRRRLVEVGLVDADMQPIAWNELQYRSDTSTERVRNYREKTRVKRDETERNVSVTVQETEKDTEEEKKEEHPSPPSVVRSPQKSRGEFLPPDWKPSLEGQRMAVAAVGSRDAALQQLEQFRDHWFAKSGADGRKRDWDAAWRNWIRRAVEYGKRNGSNQRQHRPASGHDNLLAAMDEFLGSGGHGGGGPPSSAGFDDAERDTAGVYRIPH